MLLTQRRTAVIEDPCYHALRDILTQSRCHLTPIAVDRDGLPPERYPDDSRRDLHHPQPPMPDHRHHAAGPPQGALLDKAREMDALIVEDDYEFEMSFLQPPRRRRSNRSIRTGG